MYITLKPLNFRFSERRYQLSADQNASGSNLIEQKQSDQRRVTKRWATHGSFGGVSVALLAGIKLAAWSENVLKLQLNRIWESVSVSFDSTALLILYKYKKQHQGTIEGRNLVTYFEGADNNLGARGNFIFRKLNV